MKSGLFIIYFFRLCRTGAFVSKPLSLWRRITLYWFIASAIDILLVGKRQH